MTVYLFEQFRVFTSIYRRQKTKGEGTKKGKWIFFQVKFNTIKNIHKAITFPSGKKWTYKYIFRRRNYQANPTVVSGVEKCGNQDTDPHHVCWSLFLAHYNNTDSLGDVSWVCFAIFLPLCPSKDSLETKLPHVGLAVPCAVSCLCTETEPRDVATVEFI